jgi:hypothetical protein
MYFKKSYSICFVIKNNPFLVFVLRFVAITRFYDKVYNTLFVHFQDQLLHYRLHNKNPNIKMFFHEVSKFSFKQYAFLKFIFISSSFVFS